MIGRDLQTKGRGKRHRTRRVGPGLPRHYYRRQLFLEQLEDRRLLAVSPLVSSIDLADMFDTPPSEYDATPDAVVTQTTQPVAIDIPGMELVDPVTDVAGQIIYLDFDGAEDVTYNGPVTVGPFYVPAFEGPGEVAGQEELIIASVVEQLEETFADSGVIFTTEQPADGGDFSTVYIGGDDAAFGDYGSFYGLAEHVDVGNQNQRDEAFVFANLIEPFGSTVTAAHALARTVEHETAHMLGYKHDGQQPGYYTRLPSMRATNPITRQE